jgi:hypothetical protein
MCAHMSCELIEHHHRAYLFARPGGNLFALESSGDCMREDAPPAYRFAILNDDGLFQCPEYYTFASMKRRAKKLISERTIPGDFVSDAWLVDIARKYVQHEMGGASYTATAI